MDAAIVSIGLLCVLLVIGVPMLAALTGSVIVNFIMSDVMLTTLPQLMSSGLTRFILLALPMFVLAGGIMNAGGLSGRLIDFAKSLVGSFRGGLAQVNVLTSMFFGGMVGSSTADLAGTGSILIPAMKRDGYSPEISAAISASSSGVGPLIPPSNGMILYAAITGTSLGSLFLAGLVPGALLGLTLMVLIAIIARRRGWKSMGAFQFNEVWRTGKRAILPLGLPTLIVSGLIFGVFTPTEASAFAVAYAIFLAMGVYRTISFRDLYRIFGNALQLSGELLLIVALSSALGWGLASARVPEALASIIDIIVVYDTPFLRILALVILAIIAGMFLDPLIPVLVPIILPTLILYDIDLVHFGVLMVLSIVIGQLTPPLAIALVITSKLAKVDQMKIFRANLPFFITILLFTLFIIAFPGVVTWLPNLVRN